ncbi:hypothetical protein Csa_009151, partial [Cucumis sativus]
MKEKLQTNRMKPEEMKKVEREQTDDEWSYRAFDEDVEKGVEAWAWWEIRSKKGKKSWRFRSV